ncbi:MAG: DUF177 domain-containing protein [Burkholderiales bacterium]
MLQGGVIDGLDFARVGGRRAGTLELADLPRLVELGCSVARIEYAVRGGATTHGKPGLHVDATGQVDLACQRCLEPVAVQVAAHAELELVATQREIDGADDDVDRVLASRSMVVAELVEDEVILALPMVPTHAECPVAAGDSGDKRELPFAALAVLQSGWKKSGSLPAVGSHIEEHD